MSERADEEPVDIDLMVTAAELYYEKDLTKSQIAAQLGLSRFKVARLLIRARELAIVRVQITRQPSIDEGLARALRDRLHLKRCVVVPVGRETAHGLRQKLGRASAALLPELLTSSDVVGIGWGRSITAILPFLKALPKCPVVQLGGVAGSPEGNSTELVRRFALKTRGASYPIYAPLLVPDEKTIRDLLTVPAIASTFAMQEQITVAVMAIGSWNPPQSQLRTACTPDEIAELDRLGVICEMGAALLNSKGAVVNSPTARRILAIRPELIRRIPTVIGVAGGADKVNAIDCAIRGRMINALVTDSETANALLQLHPQR